MKIKYLSFLLFISILLIGTSCKKSENLTKEEEEIIVVVPPVAAENDSNIVIKVTFSSTPSQATSSYTNLKFDKQAVFNMEWDDNSLDCLDGLAILKGGLASNGVTYSGKTFTDGCGNQINYRAALAINGYNTFNQREWGADYPGSISYTQMKELIKHGWDIENHSSRHIAMENLTLAKADLQDLNTLLFNRIGYTMNTLVVPVNYNFYMKAASELGFLSGTAQADDVKDGLPIYPTNAWKDNVDITTIPDGFAALNRAFNDDWSKTELEKSKIDKLITSSTPTSNKLFRLGSHNANDVAGFADFINHISNASQDKIWVTTMRELFEYRYAKLKTKKSEVLVGNSLTITLNQDDIANMIRWRDLTLKINSEAVVSDITITGADKSSFNKTSKLINVFKENKDFKSAALL